MTNIRLIAPRPHEAAQLRREWHEYLYWLTVASILSGLVWAAVALHAAVSVNIQ